MTLNELNSLVERYKIPAITLDFFNSSYNLVQSKQLDNCRYILCTLTENGTIRNVKSDESPRVRWLKPDDTYVYNDCETIEDGRVLISLTEQMLLVEGKAIADIQLTAKDGNIYSTKNFIVNIDRTPYSHDAIESSDEFDALNNMIKREEERVQIVLELERVVTENENIRNANEEVRKENENVRIASENERTSNENERQANEAARQTQETDRQTNTATAISNAEKATSDCIDATTDLQNKLDSHHFVLTEDKDVAGGVPSLDSTAKIPLSELYEATITSKGITQLTDSVTSTSTTTAATPNSVKNVYDKAVSLNDTTSGNLDAEIARAKTAEKTNADNLSAEVTRAKNIENTKAPLASPALTGTPTTPTATAGTSTTQIANTSFVQTAVSNHNSSIAAHSDIRLLIDGLTKRLNALADSDDTTLDQMSEIVAYIKDNKSLIDSITTSKVSVSDIINNLTTTAANKPLSANQGYVLKGFIDTLTEIVNTKSSSSDLSSHTGRTDNPHGVTKSQVGLGNVPNVTTNDQTPTFTVPTTNNSLISGEKLSVAFGKIAKAINSLISHLADSVSHITSSERTLWNTVSNKVDKVTGKVLSSNDLTNTLKSNYDKAYTHSQSAHAPSNSERNIIVGVQKNGTNLTVDSATRKVNVTVPTKLSELTNDSGYKTTDNNTTYSLTKSGSTITLTGSDGKTTSVTDSNTTYGVATTSALGLVKSGTDITVDSSGNVSVNDDSHNHVIANVDGLQTALNGKAVIKQLTSENLNNVTTPGFYNAGGGNTITNRPSGVDYFGMEVIHNASGAYYTQVLMNGAAPYRRHCTNGTWASWVQDKLTDTNTTYSAATVSTAGLMSASDKSKLDGITASADAVSFTRSLTGGTKVGTITINGTSTDLYCQTNTDTNTTYSAGTGIGLSNTTFYNTGVRSIATGSANGTISVNTNGTSANISVKGLGSAAYTASSDYAPSSHTHTKSQITDFPSSLPANGGTSSACTGNSATATKAAQDSAGQQINTTYIKSLAVNGRTITYTKGNGTTGTITTQDTNTTYGTATQSANGLMSAADKTKLDGVVTGANKTVVDSALSSTSTNPVQNKAVTAALGGKAATVHTHNYAGSSSGGGAATSAVKLTTSAGSSTQPVYFSGGKPVLCGFEFYVVDIKAPQGGSTSVTLPNGFSYENTIVVGYLAYAQQTSINVFGGSDGTNALSIKIDSNSKLTISSKTSGIYGASAKILLVKIG